MSAQLVPTKPGQLIIVGSGIGSIGQLSLQAVAHIEQADVVFYVVADSATEAFIRQKNANCVDLYKFYGDGKNRMITYIQMSEEMLLHLRKGQNVVGVFYGHPGVFVSPSHRSIDIARREGFTAKMLPGISAEDCLFADLNIDPAIPGCLTYEATDLLVRNKPLVPSSHLIVYQVGCVGITDFNFSGFNNTNFEFLLDYLETAYGPEHSVTHYIAAILPFIEPTMEKYTITELRDPDVQKQITAISTLYLPPKTVLECDKQAAVKMGMVKAGDTNVPTYPSVKWREGEATSANAYEEYERAAIEQSKSHVIPEAYKPLSVSTAMVDLMTKLALDPKALATYRQDPTLFVDSTSGLTRLEADALKLGHQGAVIASMKEGYGGGLADIQPTSVVDVLVIEAIDLILVYQ
jgi:hypothetical protein